MRKILSYGVGFIILALLTSFVYQFAINFSYTRHINLPPQLLASSTQSDVVVNDSPVQNNFGLADLSLLNPASTTVDISSWVNNTNEEMGYSVSYPKDFVVNNGTPGTLVIAIPKDKYFHWPLLDDVKITITATSSCPVLQSGSTDSHPVTYLVNGHNFIKTEGSDVVAGNIYKELAYDVVSGPLCYHIDLLDHGANGAGLYVSDQALISRYNDQHQSDLNAVLSIFVAMVNSFKIVVY